VRSTAGKKLYYNDESTGPMPPPKIQDQTRIAETRQRILYRADNGAPLHRVQNIKNFVPSCSSQAKTMIQLDRKQGGLWCEDAGHKRAADRTEHERSKNKMHSGAFKQGYHYDNGVMTDNTGRLLTKA
jgi:hypothetical protein